MSGNPPGDELIAWAAWLYYGEGKTQNEIADRLGVSRASIGNYLTEARRRGMVNISLDSNLLSQMDQSTKLISAFGLQSAYVIPSYEKDDAAVLRDRLGAAGASVLSSQVRSGEVVGVAWGRTMLTLGQQLSQSSVKELKVVQIAGSSLGGDDISPEFCTALIAAKLGARCVNFPSPAIVSSPDFREVLMREPAIIKHFELVNSCDHVIFGIGRLEEESLFADAAEISSPVIADYVRKGAICAAIGRLLDEDCNEVEGVLTGRTMSIEHDLFKKIPNRIAVAGGKGKAEPMRAMLRANYVTHLVTDSQTATEILEG